jgi:XTP/dITP diphosphohydrolase
MRFYMRFVLAGNNEKKLKEMRQILSKVNIDVISMKEAGVSTDPEETGSTFEDNALIKAQGVMKLCGLPAIADDSGLVVEALGGEPGIYSARYGAPDCKSDEDRIRLLLSKMSNLEQRNAKFVSSIVCVFPNGDKLTAYGECKGKISYSPSGSGGFGYDPVFYLPEYGKTMAQLDPQLKNRISHRAKAIEALKDKLLYYLQDRAKLD